MDTATKTFLAGQFESIRTEMVTKKDFEREIASVREDIESLVEMTSNAFTGMTERFVGLETKVDTLDSKVARLDSRAAHLETRVEHLDTNISTLVGLDPQHQIDVLRDDMRVVKTKLGLA